MDNFLLSLIIWTPLVGSLLILLVPSGNVKAIRWAALSVLMLDLLWVILAFLGFSKSAGGFYPLQTYQFVEQLAWFDLQLGGLGRLSAEYLLGVDGLSLVLVGLSIVVLIIGLISSWTIEKHQKGYFSLYLLLSGSILGCFLALDFFLFYLFFEFMLLPMYFLIGMWGGPRREYAAIKFFLYTLVGSILILVVMIALGVSVIDPIKTGKESGILFSDIPEMKEIYTVQTQLVNYQIAPDNQVHTFNMLWMMDKNNFVPRSALAMIAGGTIFGQSARLIAFLALLIGFAIKLPAVPFHTWLPDAHVEAPTPISVVLAGILLKVGAYGIIRICYGIFPEGAVYYAEFIGIMGLVAILYGALNALAMKDLKKMIAFSSISHMGYILLGLAALTVEGVAGAVYQMISHGFISALLFLLVGVIYDRTHDRSIENYRGLASKMPHFTVAILIAFFASAGLPGLSGFIAEVMVYLGAFKSESVNGLLPRWVAITATLGLVFGAAYYLWTLQRMFFGSFWTRKQEWHSSLSDLTTKEYLMMVPLILGIIVLGIFPSILLDYINPGLEDFCQRVLQVGNQNLQLLSKYIH